MVVAELLMRLNYDLMTGSFQLDFEDGEICFRTSIDLEGDRLSTALVRQLMFDVDHKDQGR